MSINTANALSARLPVPPLPDLMLEPLVRSALRRTWAARAT